MNTESKDLKILEHLKKELVDDGFHVIQVNENVLLAEKNKKIYLLGVNNWEWDKAIIDSLGKNPVEIGYLSWRYIEDEQSGDKRECHGGYTELSKNTYDDIAPTIRELEVYLTEESKIYGEVDKEDFEELKGMFDFYDFEDGLDDEIVKRWIDKHH